MFHNKLDSPKALNLFCEVQLVMEHTVLANEYLDVISVIYPAYFTFICLIFRGMTWKCTLLNLTN